MEQLRLRGLVLGKQQQTAPGAEERQGTTARTDRQPKDSCSPAPLLTPAQAAVPQMVVL